MVDDRRDMTSSTNQTPSRNVSAVAGKALEGVFAAVSRVRPADKPLHPRGALHTASIERFGMREAVGVPWIDKAGTSTGVVRLSRATGLPPSLPDIHGLALRLSDGDRPADILFATTGLGRATRFVLLPSQHAGQRAYTTLLPYRSPSGPVLLAANPVGTTSSEFTLSWAAVAGPWQDFARMTLSRSATQESPSFDPVLNQLPGLAYYAWAANLREGAYRAARRSRSGNEVANPG
jgi:hypothetical protein